MFPDVHRVLSSWFTQSRCCRKRSRMNAEQSSALWILP